MSFQRLSGIILANILDMHSNISSTTCVKLRVKNGKNRVKRQVVPSSKIDSLYYRTILLNFYIY